MGCDNEDNFPPPLRVLELNIQASVYNTIRRGLLRLNNPLVYYPARFKRVKCIFSNATWICLDESHNDLPIVAWRDFQTKNRAIHHPVPCRAHVYNIMAGPIMGTVLYNVEEHINKTIHKADALTLS